MFQIHDALILKQMMNGCLTRIYRRGFATSWRLFLILPAALWVSTGARAEASSRGEGSVVTRTSAQANPAINEIPGFQQHIQQQEQLERQREAGIEAHKKKNADWEKLRIKAIEEEKERKRKQAVVLVEGGPEYKADLKEKQNYDEELEAARRQYSAKKKSKAQPSHDSQLQELGLVPERERVPFALRVFNQQSSSFGGSSFGGGSSSGGSDFSSPPPPPPPPMMSDFTEPDIPPPPPPPPPMMEGMPEEIPPPPVFENEDF